MRKLIVVSIPPHGVPRLGVRLVEYLATLTSSTPRGPKLNPWSASAVSISSSILLGLTVQDTKKRSWTESWIAVEVAVLVTVLVTVVVRVEQPQTFREKYQAPTTFSVKTILRSSLGRTLFKAQNHPGCPV